MYYNIFVLCASYISTYILALIFVIPSHACHNLFRIQLFISGVGIAVNFSSYSNLFGFIHQWNDSHI